MSNPVSCKNIQTQATALSANTPAKLSELVALADNNPSCLDNLSGNLQQAIALILAGNDYSDMLELLSKYSSRQNLTEQKIFKIAQNEINTFINALIINEGNRSLLGIVEQFSSVISRDDLRSIYLAIAKKDMDTNTPKSLLRAESILIGKRNLLSGDNPQTSLSKEHADILARLSQSKNKNTFPVCLRTSSPVITPLIVSTCAELSELSTAINARKSDKLDANRFKSWQKDMVQFYFNFEAKMADSALYQASRDQVKTLLAQEAADLISFDNAAVEFAVKSLPFKDPARFNEKIQNARWDKIGNFIRTGKVELARQKAPDAATRLAFLQWNNYPLTISALVTAMKVSDGSAMNDFYYQCILFIASAETIQALSEYQTLDAFKEMGLKNNLFMKITANPELQDIASLY